MLAMMPPAKNRLQQAEAFLRSQLQNGSVPVAELVEEAAREGIARRTLYRAATSLPVIRLPDAEGSRRVARWAVPGAVAPRMSAPERFKQWLAAAQAELGTEQQ